MILTVASFKRGEPFIDRGVAGIYAIRNTANGKAYVGSAVSLHDRLYNHLWHLEGGTHRNRKLLNAWRKHGVDAFVLEVLELVDDSEQLTIREQFWIDDLNSHRGGYNLNPTAGSNLGRTFGVDYRATVAAAARKAMSDPAVKERHKAATRAAMARPEVREKCRRAILARNANPAAKAKLVASQKKPDAMLRKSAGLSRARMSLSPERRRALAVQAAAKRYKVFHPNGHQESIVNLKKFCTDHSLSYNSALEILRGRVRATQGYRFEREVQSL